MNRCDVSILIVNYKTPVLLDKCIASIYQFSTKFSFEIIVIDNHSEDDSQNLIRTNYPKVIWFNMGYNSGFARANNKAMKLAKGEYYLLLNSDTELYENAIFKTLNYYKINQNRLNLGLVGCKIQNRDFSLQPSCNYYFKGWKEAIEENPFYLILKKRIFKSRISRDIDKYERLNTTHKTAWLGVAYAMVKSEIVREKSMQLDEDFFMYAEDKEWCYRLNKHGYHHYFYHETGIFHINGGSSTFQIKRERQIEVSNLLFIFKTKGKLYLKIYTFIMRFGFRCDEFFYRRSKKRSLTTKLDEQMKKRRDFLKSIFQLYMPIILCNFNRKTSSTGSMLNTYNDD